MIAASEPVQRPATAKLLVLESGGAIQHLARDRFADVLRSGDLVVANDAATLPASLAATHRSSGQPIEVRLAAWRGPTAGDVRHFAAIVFGAGDYHTRTEDRLPPPPLHAGDHVQLGPLSATITSILGHPRLVALRFSGKADAIWDGIARHGRPIQYAHVDAPLALWDVWTAIAGPPVAFEPPSAGFVLSWRGVDALRQRGIGFATITHAAGISSTGDEALDKRLPFDEPYVIPQSTALAIARTRRRGGRVVAIGTTVVRALEHAATIDGTVRGGTGLATNRIGTNTRLYAVDVILSGTHEPGTSHYELLRAFADDETMKEVDEELNAAGYRTHEFGDAVLIERQDNHHAVLASGTLPPGDRGADAHIDARAW